MAGLVVLDIDLEVIQQPPAVLGGTEQVNPGAARAGPEQAWARARGSRRSSTTRIVFSSGARYRPAIGSHGARSRARSAWLARLIHCPTAVSRSFPGRGERAQRDRDQAGQRADPPPAASAGPAAPPAAATPPPPGPGRRDRIRPRAHPRATMPTRACHTSLMQTSETYMIGWRARLHQQCDFVLLVTCHTKRGNSGTRRSPG